MSADTELFSNSPSGIGDFKVTITAHDGEVFDISDNITELSLFESIYRPYIHGNMVVVDNSMILADIPMVGQERVFIQWKRDDRPLAKIFFANRVTNVSKLNDGVGVFEISLNSVLQTRNAVNLFSQSYEGLSDEIIEFVTQEHLGSGIIRMDGTVGKTEHSIVFPYMKPFQAIDMVIKNVLADDNTPMFLYETFYPNELRLDSFGRMAERESIVEIKGKTPVNDDPEGNASRKSLKERGNVYDESISRAYDVFDNLNKGSFASNIIITDPSTHQYEVAEFSYKEDAPSRFQNWISPDFRDAEGLRPENQFNAHNTYLPRNELSFNEAPPNLNTIDDKDRTILNSYIRRHATTVVKIYMDSIAYTLETNEPFTVGQTVTYDLLKSMPKLPGSYEQKDKFNSGKYIVSAIRHYVKNYEYNMSIEIIRDGIGEEASFVREEER